MKSFKILALAGALVSSSVLMSPSATAIIYSTTVSVTDLTTSLSWSETQGMQFPGLILDGATNANDYCHTGNNNSSSNSLCPGDRDGVSNSTFSLTGTPRGTVLPNLDRTPQIVEGIEFIPSNVSSTVTLDINGNGNHYVSGRLQLKDRSAVVSNSLTFTYDLELTAQ